MKSALELKVYECLGAAGVENHDKYPAASISNRSQRQWGLQKCMAQRVPIGQVLRKPPAKGNDKDREHPKGHRAAGLAQEK